MIKALIGIWMLASAGMVYAACTTHTYIGPNGGTMCTTCCFNGNCTTTCT